MSLLRIRGTLAGAPVLCQWVFVNNDGEAVIGEGPLSKLPRGAGRVQLVIPAAEVMITHARVPPQARRGDGSTLAYAVEEQTAREPDANRVNWIGTAGERDVLAVADKSGLMRWRDALGACGIWGYEVHCESLLLPWTPGEWSLAWNGHEGFVRHGEFEATTTDCGDSATPPLSLRKLLEDAAALGTTPDSIALYTTAADTAPDVGEWTRALGITVNLAGIWDWRTAPSSAGVLLTRERQRWRAFAGVAERLRPAAWILGAALAFHAGALLVDWASLANQQRVLRQQMKSQFRAVFPDAVAVVDPALQMRRKLAESRHNAGRPDSGDFLPMLDKLATGMASHPESALRVLSYESGRMTVELAITDESAVSRIVAKLTQSGLRVQRSPPLGRPGSMTVTLTVQAS